MLRGQVSHIRGDFHSMLRYQKHASEDMVEERVTTYPQVGLITNASTIMTIILNDGSTEECCQFQEVKTQYILTPDSIGLRSDRECY